MKYLPLNSQLFIQNRERFVRQLLPNSMAVFFSNDENPRSGDQTFLFRQNADLFYLSGIDQEQSILVIYPECRIEKYREILFLRETNEHIAVWEGHKYTKEEATTTSGIKTVLWLDSYESVMRDLMANVDHVYLNSNEHIRSFNGVPYRNLRMGKELQSQFPYHSYKRSAPIMAQLRTIKSSFEIELTKTAIGITAKAFNRLLAFVKPGVMEHEVEAELVHEFIRNRSDAHAFYPIVASGASACILHYEENNRECKDGDLLLLDIGAEYANYSSDLSRTIPVNGLFNKRQKEVYSACLRVQKQAIKLMVCGTTLDALHAEVCKIMEGELIKLGLFTADDVKNQDPAKPMYFKYYPHGTSHFMGLDVHDLGFKQQVFEPGMIFTCEPGIYIMDEGIGIRIENDILITENGPVDLMADIPVEIGDIEERMAKR
ncbi:MAG: aminopeptidase P N-terminal domain-containing protein [Bacteroidetes bacterium]|nr:aminopeptidase P N-terminal domain-containing protein [Bacteroidota bacterium]